MTVLRGQLKAFRDIQGNRVTDQEPVFPFAMSVYEPDMVLPANVPVKLTTPTAPKLIARPVRAPLMWRWSCGDDTMTVPSSASTACVNVSEQKPFNGPVHSPSHAPLRSGGASAAVGVEV